jgi:hypothetical protein
MNNFAVLVRDSEQQIVEADRDILSCSIKAIFHPGLFRIQIKSDTTVYLSVIINNMFGNHRYILNTNKPLLPDCLYIFDTIVVQEDIVNWHVSEKCQLDYKIITKFA